MSFNEQEILGTLGCTTDSLTMRTLKAFAGIECDAKKLSREKKATALPQECKKIEKTKMHNELLKIMKELLNEDFSPHQINILAGLPMTASKRYMYNKFRPSKENFEKVKELYRKVSNGEIETPKQRKEYIVEKINFLSDQRGFNMNKISKIVECCKPTLYNYLRCTKQVPSIKVYEKFKKSFEKYISKDDLWTGIKLL